VLSTRWNGKKVWHLTAVSHFYLLNYSNAQLLCWGALGQRPTGAGGIPFPFCQITLKAEKPLKDRHTKSFYRQQLKNVGVELSRKRLELGISQMELARKVGVHAETIANWEHRCSIPDIGSLPRIIKFLGYDPLEFAKKVD
jgi:DNA-binding transcriptional regulator YiaG